jgi:hypothetical protein
MRKITRFLLRNIFFKKVKNGLIFSLDCAIILLV